MNEVTIMEVEVSNKHPADELAEIRLKLREWKGREEELRSIILDLPAAEREGRKYIATVNEEMHRRIDIPALEERFGDLSEFYKSSFYNVVRTKRKK